MPIEGEPHQASALFYYFLPPGLKPTFVVDVSDWAEEWRRALECHQSQFSNPDRPRPEGTAATNFLDWFEVFARQHAFPIGARYAQAYYSAGALKINQPMMLVKDIVPRV